jgi:hypothetical protein
MWTVEKEAMRVSGPVGVLYLPSRTIEPKEPRRKWTKYGDFTEAPVRDAKG